MLVTNAKLPVNSGKIIFVLVGCRDIWQDSGGKLRACAMCMNSIFILN